MSHFHFLLLISRHSLQVPTVGRLPRTPEQFWLEHVRICFPEYRSRTYFFPSIHVSLVSYSVAVIADQQVLVPQEPQEEADRMLSPAERKRSRRRSLAEVSTGDGMNGHNRPLASKALVYLLSLSLFVDFMTSS